MCFVFRLRTALKCKYNIYMNKNNLLILIRFLLQISIRFWKLYSLLHSKRLTMNTNTKYPFWLLERYTPVLQERKHQLDFCSGLLTRKLSLVCCLDRFQFVPPLVLITTHGGLCTVNQLPSCWTYHYINLTKMIMFTFDGESCDYSLSKLCSNINIWWLFNCLVSLSKSKIRSTCYAIWASSIC